MTSKPQRTSQEQFGRMASAYRTSTTHLQRDALVDLGEVVARRPGPYRVGLDIGTGPGFTAFAVAPYCETVIATDVTPRMLEQVRALRDERGAPRTQIALAAAEALPFADASIDLVVTRTASHHFLDFDRWLAETVRVLAPGGVLVACDTCAPEDETAAEWMHDIEVRRDASHVRNLPPSQWRRAVEHAGLRIEEVEMSYVVLQYPDWVQRAGTPAEEAEAIRRDMLAAPPSAQHAFEFAANPNGTIDFHWDVITLVATKETPAS